MDAVTTYRLYAANAERTRKLVEENPIVSREVEYYQENISDVKSIDDLMEDTRLLKVALTAFGLEEMTYAKAFIKKALEGGIDDNDSFANRLTDTRYQDFVETFNFARHDTATTAFGKVTEGVIEKYYQANIETRAGDENTGARLAMYFERKAADITDAYSILADTALLEIVQTTFRLPTEMSFSDIERQAEIIEDRIDLEKLTDPEYVGELVGRFLAMWDLDNPNAGSSSSSVIPLINTNSNQQTTMNLLTAISSLNTQS